MSDKCKHGRMHCVECHMNPETELEKANATIAEQAKMIEHLRGGPTPLYTAVDMANAARDGFRDGAKSRRSIILGLTKELRLADQKIARLTADNRALLEKAEGAL